MERWKIGHSAPLTQVASTVSRVDGSYTLTTSADLRRFVGRSTAAANFTLIAQAPGTAPTVRAFSASPSRTNSSRWATQTLSLKLKTPATTHGSAAAAGRVLPRYVCTTELVKTYDPVWARVGRLDSLTNRGTADFKFKKGGSTTLGVAVSAMGSAGGFSQEGTSTTATDATLNFPALGAYQSRAYRTQFSYGNFRTTCNYPGVWWHEARVSDHWGGVEDDDIQPVTSDKCANMAAGSGQTYDESKASTTKVGVKIAHYVGIDLSSQSGYSTGTSVSVQFDKAGRLCGVNGGPAATPGSFVLRGPAT